MSIKSELRKEGIEVISKLNTLKVNSIAHNIATTLVNNFPEQNINYHELFIKLSRLNMYIAKMPDGAAAKYFYKNTSIYFNETIDLENLDSLAIHECIHFIQEEKDSKNNLKRLGLCDFTDVKFGMALNEAAVQLMTAKCSKTKMDTVKYFDITLPTNSPNYYPLECNLVNQMAYITGDYVLYNSTIFSNDNFKNKFITLTSKKAYDTIKNNINTIMYLEDELAYIYSILELENNVSSKVARLINKSTRIKKEIARLFIETQNKIFTSFFDKAFSSLYSTKSLENYRNALYNYKNLIGVTDNYSYFNDYYIDKMASLEEKYNILDNNSLVPVKQTFFSTLIRKIRILLGKKEYEINTNIFNK